MPPSDTDTPGTNRICSDCVSETFLKERIATDGTQDVCDYCDEEGSTISVEELADFIERAFEDHYERTTCKPDEWE